GGPEASVLSVAIHPVNPGTMFIGTKAGLFRTDSGGKRWRREQHIPTDAVVPSLSLRPSKPYTLFAATERVLFRSRGGAAGWERLLVRSTPLEGEAAEGTDEEAVNDVVSNIRWVAVNPIDPETVYLATSNGLLISRDDGVHWKQGGGAGLVSSDIRNLVTTTADPGTVYAATKRGVFRYTELSRSWRPLYKGLTSSDVRFVAAGRNDSPVLWAATRRGAFKAVAVEGSEMAVQGGEGAERILTQIGEEPTIHEIQRAAIKYAEVHPGKIEKWRKAAARKALLPDLKVAYDKSKDWQSSTYFYSTSSQKYTDDDITLDRDWSWSVSATWDLGELIWNNDQTSIDTRSRLMVQLRDDVLNEVTRLYFERKRLQAELLHSPPQGVMEKVEKELRLQELTADIDALTGFYLSRRLEQAKASH
ncbi:MAG: WD40/YVTN/BNR-like repeat-containing protein, partial [Thermodesulfobacteriota bacterium]